MAVFEQDVLPVIDRFARKVFGRDDERHAKALVLGWWVWSNRRADFPPSFYAKQAVRHVWSGRDLPGVKTSHNHDVFDRLTCWGGAGMGEVRDRRPGPSEQAAASEDLERFFAQLDSRQERMVDAYLDGASNEEVAALIGVSPPRATQLRQAMKRLLD